MLAFFLVLSGSLPACNTQYENREEVERYTSVNQLSEAQSREIDQLVFKYMNTYTYVSVGLVGQDGALLIRSYG
ncbi:MAG: hypothetical protein P8100_15505, partial [bacterium]